MLFFRIDPVLHTIVGEKEGVWIEGEYNSKETSLLNRKVFLVPVVVTEPAFNSEIEYLSDAVDSYDYVTNIATRVYSIITKSQAELDAEQLDQDIEDIQNYGKDTILVLIQLVDKLIADAVIEQTDFDSAVKDAYLEIKPIADRIIANQ